MAIRSVWFLCSVCFISLLAMSVEAGPPSHPKQNRSYQTYAMGDDFQSSESGWSQAGIYASENYDVKGVYDSSFISVHESELIISGEDQRHSYRVLECAVNEDAIFATRLWTTVGASLDTASPSCVNFGSICDYHPDTGTTCEPYEYEGIVEIRGNWWLPHVSSFDNVQRRITQIGAPTTRVTHCQASFGEAYYVGRFSINDLVAFFNGPEGTTVSSTMVYNCNENNPKF